MLHRIMKNTSHQVMGEDTVSDLYKIFNGIGTDFKTYNLKIYVVLRLVAENVNLILGQKYF